MLRKNGTSLSQLEEEMGVEFIDAVVPRLFKEVITNIFKTAPPRWKLENPQKGWSEERVKGTMEQEAKGGKEEIKDSQMVDEGTI